MSQLPPSTILAGTSSQQLAAVPSQQLEHPVLLQEPPPPPRCCRAFVAGNFRCLGKQTAGELALKYFLNSARYEENFILLSLEEGRRQGWVHRGNLWKNGGNPASNTPNYSQLLAWGAEKYTCPHGLWSFAKGSSQHISISSS